MIDICTTATIRPHILDRTLESFAKNLLYKAGVPVRMIINIDPVGENRPAQEVINVCKSYVNRGYLSELFVCEAEKPHFTTAFLWCWKQVENPYVLQLEDDWLLLGSLFDGYLLF